MNELQKALFFAPKIVASECPFCGRPTTNRHHIIPRSQGGKDGPTIDVCGMGNASGCHGKLHSHLLHLRYTHEWEFLETREPTKYQDALAMDGWQSLKNPYLNRLDKEAYSIREHAEKRQRIFENGIDYDG